MVTLFGHEVNSLGFKETIGRESQDDSQQIPETAYRVFTNDEAKEERRCFAIGFEMPLFENNPFDKPTDQK